MNITIEDYETALREFASDLGRTADDIVSVILYGSLARGNITPGKSDLMDAQVFLRSEVFESKEKFISILESLVDSCRHLTRYGIPFHPFHYFSVDEMKQTPALYLATWRSPTASKILLGEDIRCLIDSTPSSRAIARTSFFEARRNMAQTLSIYLNKPEWVPRDRHNILRSLASLKKHLPVMACETLGMSKESSEAIDALKQAILQLDTTALDRIDDPQNQFRDGVNDQGLREALRAVLTFIENLHDRIVTEHEDSIRQVQVIGERNSSALSRPRKEPPNHGPN